MLTVLVTVPTVTQHLPFFSLSVAIAIARTHVTYPRMDDQAAGLGGSVKYRGGITANGHPSQY